MSQMTVEFTGIGKRTKSLEKVRTQGINLRACEKEAKKTLSRIETRRVVTNLVAVAG